MFGGLFIGVLVAMLDLGGARDTTVLCSGGIVILAIVSPLSRSMKPLQEAASTATSTCGSHFPERLQKRLRKQKRSHLLLSEGEGRMALHSCIALGSSFRSRSHFPERHCYEAPPIPSQRDGQPSVNVRLLGGGQVKHLHRGLTNLPRIA